LGKVCADLGEKERAQDYYKRALSIFREERDRGEEGKTLLNTGTLYLEQRRHDVALACFLLVKNIFEEVPGQERDLVQQWIDNLHGKVGDEQFTVLLAQVEAGSEQIVEQALSDLQ
jgi:tetratricopeptide (TPR) repeat protein